MKTPYEILSIPRDSDDEIVKKGYLVMVKRYPPERFPKEFQRIRAAYESVKTQKARMSFFLFDTTLPDVDELIEDVRAGADKGRPDLQTMRRLLATSMPNMETTR